MARVKALRTFTGVVSAVKGQTLDIPDRKVLKDLIDAGYVVSLRPIKNETE